MVPTSLEALQNVLTNGEPIDISNLKPVIEDFISGVVDLIYIYIDKVSTVNPLCAKAVFTIGWYTFQVFVWKKLDFNNDYGKEFFYAGNKDNLYTFISCGTFVLTMRQT